MLPSRTADRYDVSGGALAADGLLRRSWPFVVPVGIGFVLTLVQGVDRPATLAVAAALAVLICVAAVAVPWARLPRAAQAVPPLAVLPVLVLLEDAGGGASSGIAPLVIVPVFWLALYGSSRELLVAIGAVALTFGIPLVTIGAPDYPSSEWKRLILWVLAAGLIGLTVHRLMRTVREGVRSGDALKTAIVESALDCVITMDHEGRVIEFNPAAERTFGYTREDAVGEELAELIVPPALRDAHRRGLARGKGSALDRRLELTGMRRDGSEFPVELTITRIGGVQPPTFAGYIRDITERRRAERDAAAQHGVARALAESATVDEAIPKLLRALGESMDWELGAVWLVDPDADALRCSALWQKGAEVSSEFRELSSALSIARGVGPLGSVWNAGEPATSADAASEPDYPRAQAAAREGLRAALWMPIRSGAEVLGVVEFYSHRPNRLDEALLATLSTVGNQIGEFFRRRQAEERLAHQALHDALTGLPNRNLLLDRLGHALERSRRHGSMVAVIFMDLDNFKVINDSLGHHVGDELLLALAARIAGAVRETDTVGRLSTDTVARFGGDEFVVLCEDIGADTDAARIAERIAAELARPEVLGGRELAVTASMGIAVGSGARDDPEGLVRDADAAMYRAKEHGRGRYEIFDEAMRTRLLERLAGETELERAIERQELSLHYQPIVAIADGAIHGFEALIRWNHPERGMVSPGAFIPIAEASGLIVELGRWALAEACREAVRWREVTPLRISVNLSPRQLTDRQLPEYLAAVLQETGLPPAALGLELTESLLMQDVDSATGILRALKACGVELHLDDFGTGYSSLSYLTSFPLDVLKLDRSFVSGLATDAGEAAIVTAVIEMARALGMTVIAEGVETEEQLASLRELGCPLAQGYHFARPMPADAATDFLHAVSAQR